MSGLSSASAGLTGDLAATGTSGNLLINSSGDVGAATGTTWNSANQRLRIDGLASSATATATPAGGSTSVRLVFGTTAGFGVYVGSGAPTVSAAQGSLYLRSDGSSTSTRAYINSDGSTTWVAVTTAS